MSAVAATRAEWLAERRHYLGGTDMAAILGLHPYKTALEVWLEKTGRVPADDDMLSKPAAYAGILLEPMLAQLYERINLVETMPGSLVRHPDYPFLGGNPDRMRPDGIGVELKTYGSRMAHKWGEQGTDQIPTEYVVQCVQYLGLTGAPEWHVLGFNRDDCEWREYVVRHDPDLWGMVVERGAKFWRDHIEADKEPPAVAADDDVLRERFAQGKPGVVIEADQFLDAVVAKAMKLGSQAREIYKERDGHIATLRQAMGEATELVSIHGTVKWPAGEETKTNWELVAIGALKSLPKQDADALVALHTETKPKRGNFALPRSKKEVF